MWQLVIVLILGSQVFAPRAFAAEKTKLKPKPVRETQAKFIRNLLKRCENGNGYSCAEYGRILSQSGTTKGEKAAQAYTRRACTLAYAPACDKGKSDTTRKPALAGAGGLSCVTPEALAAIEISAASNGRKIVHLERDSLWDKNGFRAGDVLMKANGKPFTDKEQLAGSPDSKYVAVDVERGGRNVHISINCP